VEDRRLEKRSGQIKTENSARAASVVSIHHLRPRTGMVGPVLV